MRSLIAKITLILLLGMPVATADTQPPLSLEVTGVVVSHSKKFKSSAIVNDRIWWEGQTIRVRKEDDTWVTLTLTKVEMIQGRGGVLTFTVETEDEEKPTFQVGIKKATGWGLTR
tara:strand:+ start:102 stop:446 length:345 start_codon:yes stop_codon:yes gene_type:complete